jgi:hypothetical protein
MAAVVALLLLDRVSRALWCAAPVTAEVRPRPRPRRWCGAHRCSCHAQLRAFKDLVRLRVTKSSATGTALRDALAGGGGSLGEVGTCLHSIAPHCTAHRTNPRCMRARSWCTCRYQSQRGPRARRRACPPASRAAPDRLSSTESHPFSVCSAPTDSHLGARRRRAGRFPADAAASQRSTCA